MAFLGDDKALLETVDGTLEKCDILLNEVKKARTPQEKHDLIDTTSNTLCLLLDPCEFVRQLHPSESFRHNASLAFDRGFEYMCQVNIRRDLYDELKAMAAQPQALTPGAFKNVQQFVRDMENNGIHLDDGRRQRIQELTIERERLASEFLLKAKSPLSVLGRLLKVRHASAEAMDYSSFAEQQLRGNILTTPDEVWHFLGDVSDRHRSDALREVELIRKHTGEVACRDELTDITRARVSQSLLSNVEPPDVYQYFTVGNCIRGIQCICSEVFGLSLKQVPFEEFELFHISAKKYHVYDEEKKFVGVIVLDMFARKEKKCEGAHLTVQLGCTLHPKALSLVGLESLGTRQYPIVVLTCNAGSRTKTITLNADGTPNEEATFMTPHEVTTCFHEFGHALHSLLGQTDVQNLSGTRSSTDYVEIFSQLLEQFLTSHEFLKLWAHKIGSHEPIPFDLCEKRNRALGLFRNLDVMDQVVLSSIDQTLHGPQPFTVYFSKDGSLVKRTLGDLGEYGKGMYNLAKLLIDTAKPISVVNPTERGVLQSLSHDHLASYPGSYYAYLYSLTIARRIWTKNFRDKPMNRIEGSRLASLMSLGAACNPREELGKYLGDDMKSTSRWLELGEP